MNIWTTHRKGGSKTPCSLASSILFSYLPLGFLSEPLFRAECMIVIFQWIPCFRLKSLALKASLLFSDLSCIFLAWILHRFWKKTSHSPCSNLTNNSFRLTFRIFGFTYPYDTILPVIHGCSFSQAFTFISFTNYLFFLVALVFICIHGLVYCQEIFRSNTRDSNTWLYVYKSRTSRL